MFEYDGPKGEAIAVAVKNINPYLVDASDIVVTSRRKTLCSSPSLSFGNMPNDGGNLLLTENEKSELLKSEPAAAPLIRMFLGPDEFLYDTPRWCFWLVDVSPAAMRACPQVSKRIDGVRTHRLASSRPETNRLATTPGLFGEIRQPSTQYLAIPKTSSENRTYIPMGFLPPDVIASTDLFSSAEATVYDFGVLTSAMHMAWMRAVAGRLESRYRYSASLAYNNFPWPEDVSDKNRAAVDKAAQEVLDSRKQYPNSTLADLYDPLTMPALLIKAHIKLDKAVDRCYRKAAFKSDRERVEHLFTIYERLTAPLAMDKEIKHQRSRKTPRTKRLTTGSKGNSEG